MRHLAFALLLASTGCSDMMADHDRNVFGDEMGEFHVVANLDDTSCGLGAADSPEQWEFDVRLSRDGSALYWNNGAAAVEGQIASDGVSFAFASQTEVDVADPMKETPGCTMFRDDEASGKFDAPEQVQRFNGHLSYSFSAAQGSLCDDLIGVPGGFAALPCEMTYGMSATLTRSPAQITEDSK